MLSFVGNQCLILGVCLQCLAHSPTGDTRDKIDLSKATKCFTVLRWLFSSKYVDANRVPVELAMEIVSILANGLGSIESGSEIISTMAVDLLSCLISDGNLNWLKGCFINETNTGFGLCHKLIEYCARIVHHVLRTKDTVSHVIKLKPMSTNSVVNSIKILNTVLLCLPDEAANHYRASLLKFIFIIHTALLRVEEESSLKIVKELQNFVGILIECDLNKKLNNEAKSSTKGGDIRDLYESLCSNLLGKIQEEYSIGGLNLQSSHAYGAMQSTLIYLIQLCREDFQLQLFFDTIVEIFLLQN